jgi:hypothetical protein
MHRQGVAELDAREKREADPSMTFRDQSREA